MKPPSITGESPDEQHALGRDRAASQRAQVVRAACRELGFDDVGIASADAALFGCEQLTDAASESRLDVLGYLAASAAARADVQTFLPGAKSVVVVVANYYRGDHDVLASTSGAADLNGRAKVSRYAWGRDYHNIIKKRLRRLRKRFLRDPALGEARWAPFCDTEAVLERAWAQAAGLGFVGKSGLFIHRSFGTWTFLGGLVTDLALAPSRAPADKVTDRCGTCRRCLDACPTDAFIAPWTLDIARCLTTWSVERPHDDPPASLTGLEGHGWAAGCDVCQEVCPHNRFATVTDDERFAPRQGLVALSSDDVEALTEEQLVGSPLSRPGRAGLRRSVARARNRPPADEG